MTARRLGIVLAIVLVLGAADPAAGEQTGGGPMVEGPPGSSGGLFGGHRPVPPGSAAQQLAITFDTVSGYDANDTEALNPGADFVSAPSGYVTNTNLSLRYRNGSAQRYVLGAGNAYVNHHSEASRVVGGDAAVQFASVGRKTGISASVSMAYEPTFLFNSFGPVSGQTDVEFPAGVSPTQGVTDQQWVAFQGGTGVNHNWTGRQRSSVQYATSFREPTTGEGYDSRSIVASLQHVWNFHSALGLEAGYSFSRNQQAGADGNEPPVRTESGTAGLRFQRRLSPVRTYGVSFGGGSMRSVVRPTASSEELTFISPKVFGSARLDVSRLWQLSLDADRNVHTLEGLTPEPFVTNTVALSVDGGVGRRLRVQVVGARSVGAALISETGAFEAISGSVNSRLGLSSWCALSASYSYYDYVLEELPTLLTSVPTRYSNHSVRIGMTLWVPLFGSF